MTASPGPGPASEPERSLRTVALDTIVLSAAQVLNRAKGLLLIPLVVGGIGLEGYGAFVQILAVVHVLTSLATLELGLGLERFASALRADERDERARHFWSVLIATLAMSCCGAVAFWFAAPQLADWILAGQHADALALGAFILVSNSIFSVARHEVRARRRFRLESALDLLYQLGPYVALAVVVVGRRDLVDGLAAYAIADGVAAGIALLCAARRLPPRRPSATLLRRYLRYSAPLAVSLIEGNLLARVDLFFLGSMVGLEAVAAYNVAYKLCEALNFATVPIHVQLLSYLSRVWDRGQRESVRRVLRHALLLLLFAAAGLIAGLYAYLDPLLDLLLGEARPDASLRAVVLLVGLGMVANAIRRMLYVVIRLEQQTPRELLYQAIGLATNVAANLLLIPRYGLEGAALATLLSYGVMLPFIGARFTIGIDLGFVARASSFAALAVASAALAVLLVPPRSLAPATGSALLMAAGYVALTLGTGWTWLRSLRTDLESVRESHAPSDSA